MGHVRVEVVQSAFWVTNAGIITAPDGSTVLVDPGVFPEELAAIARRAGEGQLLAAISTHEDWDHVLWSADFPAGVPRLGHPATVRILEDDRDGFLRTLARWESELGVSWDHELAGRLHPVQDETVLLNGLRIRLVPTPGHTPGHTSLWLEDEGVLFAGDMLSDIDIPMLAPVPGAGEVYLRSLKTLETFLETATMVIPGHGTPCGGEEAQSRHRADRAYLEAFVAWTREERGDFPALEAFIPGDTRASRSENRDAHLHNGAAVVG